MERSLPKIAIICTLFFLCFSTFAQEYSIRDEIRIRVWSEIDAYPGGDFEDQQTTDVEVEKSPTEYDSEDNLALYRYAIERIKVLAPYMISGMLYGWTFEYTPSDKTRAVEEYFDFSLVKEFDQNVNHISIHYPEVRDDQLVTWAWCDRTSYQKDLYDNWTSVTNPKIHGIGSAEVSLGFEGIKQACGEAIKKAVRAYYQQTLKDKPKEISGKVLLVKEPRIYIKDGHYTVDLDFFMETDRIILYTFY